MAHRSYPDRTPKLESRRRLVMLLATTHAAAYALAAWGQEAVAAQALDTSASPRLVVAERTVELGTMQAGDTAPMVWRLENQGDADLVVSRVKPGCGCTIVELNGQDRVIHPGEHFDLRAMFHSTGRRGLQNRKVTVFSNDPDEPRLELSFRAVVERLYEVVPSQIVNLRSVQRGAKASKTIDVIEDAGHGPVEVLGIDTADGAPVSFSIKPFAERNLKGQRIHVTVQPDAAVGRLAIDATIRIAVGGTEHTHGITIRAEVVGDITWQPRVVDATRQPARPGRKLAPVDIRAAGGATFRITGVSAGPDFDVEVIPPVGSKTAKRHLVTLVVREDTNSGPIAAWLRIETDAPDQPVIKIPAYAFVLPALDIDPPVVILQADGTPAGMSRRLKLQTYPGRKLEITSYASDLDRVTVQPATSDRTPQRHIRYFDVQLQTDAGSAAQTGELTFETTVPGYERVRIPVTVRKPE